MTSFTNEVVHATNNYWRIIDMILADSGPITGVISIFSGP